MVGASRPLNASADSPLTEAVVRAVLERVANDVAAGSADLSDRCNPDLPVGDAPSSSTVLPGALFTETSWIFPASSVHTPDPLVMRSAVFRPPRTTSASSGIPSVASDPVRLDVLSSRSGPGTP